jgi:hypothetical protein
MLFHNFSLFEDKTTGIKNKLHRKQNKKATASPKPSPKERALKE